MDRVNASAKRRQTTRSGPTNSRRFVVSRGYAASSSSRGLEARTTPWTIPFTVTGTATYTVQRRTVLERREETPISPCIAAATSGRKEWFSIRDGSSSESARTTPRASISVMRSCASCAMRAVRELSSALLPFAMRPAAAPLAVKAPSSRPCTTRSNDMPRTMLSE